MAESKDILVTENVVKRFGGLVAVNKMNFTLERGRIFSIIGPNGAGKTTFFNTISYFHFSQQKKHGIKTDHIDRIIS